MSFSIYSGETEDLTVTDNYVVFQWDQKPILFSASQIGKAMVVHIGINRANMKYARKAADEFSEFIFDNFDWCRMMIALIERKSVQKMVEKINFIHVGNYPNGRIYARGR